MPAVATKSKPRAAAMPAAKPAAKPADEKLDETLLDETGAPDEAEDDDRHEEEAEEAAPGDAEEEEEEEEPEAPAEEKPEAAAPEAAANPDEVTLQISEGFDVMDFPLEDLKLNKVRQRSEDDVASMVRSIKANGLQYPVIISEDQVVIDGNARVLAYRALKRKTVPARFLTDLKGDRVKAKDAPAQIQMLVANAVRRDLTPMQAARAYNVAIESGAADNSADLARKMGLSAAEVSRTLKLFTDGTKKLHDALEEGTITLKAADKIISRCKNEAEINLALSNAAKVAEGKITTDTVDSVAPARRNAARRGRQPKISGLPGDALKTEDTGITGSVRMVGRKSFVLNFTVAIDLEDVDTFARVDVARKVQAAFAKLDPKAVREALENARKKLTD